jgi:hypothetical protein
MGGRGKVEVRRQKGERRRGREILHYVQNDRRGRREEGEEEEEEEEERFFTTFRMTGGRGGKRKTKAKRTRDSSLRSE